MVAPARITEHPRHPVRWVVGVNRKHMDNGDFAMQELDQLVDASTHARCRRSHGSGSKFGLVEWTRLGEVQQRLILDSKGLVSRRAPRCHSGQCPKRAVFGLRRAAHVRRHPCKSRGREVHVLGREGCIPHVVHPSVSPVQSLGVRKSTVSVNWFVVLIGKLTVAFLARSEVRAELHVGGPVVTSAGTQLQRRRIRANLLLVWRSLDLSTLPQNFSRIDSDKKNVAA